MRVYCFTIFPDSIQIFVLLQYILFPFQSHTSLLYYTRLRDLLRVCSGMDGLRLHCRSNSIGQRLWIPFDFLLESCDFSPEDHGSQHS